MFLLIGLIFMDAETGLLPREFTYPGIVLGLCLSCIATTDSAGTAFLLAPLRQEPFLACTCFPCWTPAWERLVGAGFFYLAWAIYYLVRKQHGLGFGDIALMGMAGAFLGLKLIVLVIVAGADMRRLLCRVSLGSGGVSAATSQPSADEAQPFLGREIPFGVFLGACSLFAVFAGEAMWAWYLGMF